jgi:hypothetical protein
MIEKDPLHCQHQIENKVYTRDIGDTLTVHIAADHFAVFIEYADTRHQTPNGNKRYRIKLSVDCLPTPRTSIAALGPFQPIGQ